MANQHNFCVSSVKLKPLKSPASGELAEHIYRKCFFCEKDTEILSANGGLLAKLSGPDRHYCEFCLRHGYNTRNSKHILPLSFRSIIGHFFYQPPSPHRRLYVSEIQDFIDSHVQAGLLNPVFNYDPETYLWFVDFSRVGKSKKKLPLSSVLHTVIDILTCFNLSEMAPSSEAVLYSKYKDAITNFYERRHRPPDRRMLIPSVDASTADKSRNFTCREMFAKK